MSKLIEAWIYEGCRRKTKVGQARTWDEWVHFLSHRHCREEKDGPSIAWVKLWSPDDDPRRRSDIKGVTAISLDIDGGLSPEKAREILGPVSMFMHSTHSEGHYRVILPLTYPIDTREFVSMHYGLHFMLNRCTDMNSSRSIDRPHYLPSSNLSFKPWSKVHWGKRIEFEDLLYFSVEQMHDEIRRSYRRKITPGHRVKMPPGIPDPVLAMNLSASEISEYYAFEYFTSPPLK